ncbi:putative sulfurtransferase DsrE [invertebrate metagenome]|uniref:Putative sulfurtransferase DsrE n=1 Tax=invertebrate metagenome TaxID=1711999 RepID=A0A2H9T6Q5_9ZZZZ
MNYAINICGAPGSSQAPQTALNFCKALITAGHTITRLFFYHDGVYTTTSLMTPPQDEQNLSYEWQAFVKEHQLDSVVCIAAALRRGVVDQTEAQRYTLSAYNLAPEHKLSGLGQLLDAAITADRFITFGA